MNLKAELQNMNLSDLRFVCQDLGLSCPKTKISIINRLLQPLRKKYKMEQWKQDGEFLPENVVKEIQTYFTAEEFAKSNVNKAARYPGKLQRTDPRREILRDTKDRFRDIQDNYMINLRKYNVGELHRDGTMNLQQRCPREFLKYIRRHKLPLNDVLSIVDDPLSGYPFSKKDVLEEINPTSWAQKRWLNKKKEQK